MYIRGGGKERKRKTAQNLTFCSPRICAVHGTISAVWFPMYRICPVHRMLAAKKAARACSALDYFPESDLTLHASYISGYQSFKPQNTKHISAALVIQLHPLPLQPQVSYYICYSANTQGLSPSFYWTVWTNSQHDSSFPTCDRKCSHEGFICEPQAASQHMVLRVA